MTKYELPNIMLIIHKPKNELNFYFLNIINQISHKILKQIYSVKDKKSVTYYRTEHH